MCKGKQCPNVDKCKCNKGTPKGIIEGSFNVIGIEENSELSDYICTTSPHHLRNRVDTESTTFTNGDENLYLINLGEI